MQSKEAIREELARVVAHEPNNYDAILELSSKLARYDSESVRFSVDAGVIDRLGKELVARHETAVSELVKNAYDADAVIVDLLFENTDVIGGTLTIEDDGHGMSRDQLIDGFMRISSSEKLHNPVTPKYKRKRAGRKGIGRFATQRLGSSLTIITQTEDSPLALVVNIDWNLFESNRDLQLVANRIDSIPKNKPHGTTLIIKDLREWWTDASIRRVYRYVADIIQPFPLSNTAGKADSDPGFKARCFKVENNELISVADEESMFYDHAIAVIDGRVNNIGVGTWDIYSEKLEIDDRDMPIGLSEKQPDLPFNSLKNVHLKVYYYIFNVGLIPKMVESYIRESNNQRGGIRIYRNGFRILPYGEQNNDWVGLDESIRRRTYLPPHANFNFLGLVEISDPVGVTFDELSSREGLFKNEAFDELVDFVYRVLISAISRVASARGRKITTNQRNWQREDKPVRETIFEIADDLSKLADDYENTAKGEADSFNDKNLGDNFRNDDWEKRAEELRSVSAKLLYAAEQLSELGMIRVLAGLGITIGEFIHEIKQYLPAFAVDSNYLVENLSVETELYLRAVRLEETFSAFNTYTAYFDRTISQNVYRNLVAIEIRDVVNSFLKVINPDLIRNNFSLDKSIKGYDLYTCKMHPSEWASILFNLYSNAKKAIKRTIRPDGKILIKAGMEDEKIYLEFQDNGIGVPKGNEEKIFNAFFTTSTPKGHSASYVEELTGTGLGLKIIRDIVTGYGGEIFLSSAANEYSTCFRIEIPKATKREIDEAEV